MEIFIDYDKHPDSGDAKQCAYEAHPPRKRFSVLELIGKQIVSVRIDEMDRVIMTIK